MFSKLVGLSQFQKETNIVMDIFANGCMLNYCKDKYHTLLSGYFSFELFGGVAFKIFAVMKEVLTIIKMLMND